MMALKAGPADGGFNIFDSKEIQDNFTGDKNRKIMLEKLVKQGQVGTL